MPANSMGTALQENEIMGLVDILDGEADQAMAAYKQADEQLRLLKDQYRRLQADFDNFRSRAVRTSSEPLRATSLSSAATPAFCCHFFNPSDQRSCVFINSFRVHEYLSARLRIEA
jgi:hypothetical protein